MKVEAQVEVFVVLNEQNWGDGNISVTYVGAFTSLEEASDKIAREYGYYGLQWKWHDDRRAKVIVDEGHETFKAYKESL